MSTDAERREATDLWTIQLREQQLRELRQQLATTTTRAEAAEAQLALADRFGADQWRRGASNKEPQEFDEWQRVQA